MLYVIKLQKSQKYICKFVVPPQLSKKLNWNKSQAFRIYAYDHRVFVLEPIDDLNICKPFVDDTDPTKPIFYVKPLNQYVNYGFNVPKQIQIKLDLPNIKLLAVHETGTKTIFLEVFSNGSKT